MPALTRAEPMVTSVGASDSDSPPSDAVGRVARRLMALQPSRPVAVALSLLVALAASYGDSVTSAAATFTLFYAFAVALGTWFGGIGIGYLVAIVALAGSAVAILVTAPHASGWFIAWNTSLDLALYAVCVHVLWALRRRLERETSTRQDAVGQLRHAERLTTIGKLASGIAHEIGTPLNVISGRAELIASGTLNADAVRASATIVIEQTDRVASTIRQLLNFARRGGTEVSRTDLTDLVETTALFLAPVAAKEGAEVACTGVHAEANVNRAEIQQVIVNLLTNAMHAMPGGGRVEIETGTARTSAPGRREAGVRQYAVVRVRDHGTGIPAETLPKIFDPFFTTKDLGRGTGLGLSVAYGIVQDHQGWISVDTRIGEGTTMSVYLPQ